MSVVQIRETRTEPFPVGKECLFFDIETRFAELVNLE